MATPKMCLKLKEFKCTPGIDSECKGCSENVTDNRQKPEAVKSNSTDGLDGEYAWTVGKELHPKLGGELAKKAAAIENYADSLCKRIKNGDPIRREEAHTISCMAFDLGQHIQWHLKHKAI